MIPFSGLNRYESLLKRQDAVRILKDNELRRLQNCYNPIEELTIPEPVAPVNTSINGDPTLIKKTEEEEVVITEPIDLFPAALKNAHKKLSISQKMKDEIENALEDKKAPEWPPRSFFVQL